MTSSSVASLPIVPAFGIAAPAGRQAPPRSTLREAQIETLGRGEKEELAEGLDVVVGLVVLRVQGIPGLVGALSSSPVHRALVLVSGTNIAVLFAVEVV